MITLYNPFSYPYLDYDIETWASVAKINFASLFKLQKKLWGEVIVIILKLLLRYCFKC